MTKNKDPKVIIDGTEYYTEDLSDQAKKLIQNIEFVDERIQQLNNEWAVADTARIGYSQALKREAPTN